MDNKSRDAFRTISEVADWLETPTHVLRFWESRFTQVKPVKRAGGRRYYRPNDMLLLGGIKKLLHEDGMTIRGVQKLLREQGVKHVAGLSPLVVGGDDDDVVEAEAQHEAPKLEPLVKPEVSPEIDETEAPMAVDVEPLPATDNVVPMSQAAPEEDAPRDEPVAAQDEDMAEPAPEAEPEVEVEVEEEAAPLATEEPENDAEPAPEPPAPEEDTAPQRDAPQRRFDFTASLPLQDEDDAAPEPREEAPYSAALDDPADQIDAARFDESAEAPGDALIPEDDASDAAEAHAEAPFSPAMDDAPPPEAPEAEAPEAETEAPRAEEAPKAPAIIPPNIPDDPADDDQIEGAREDLATLIRLGAARKADPEALVDLHARLKALREKM